MYKRDAANAFAPVWSLDIDPAAGDIERKALPARMELRGGQLRLVVDDRAHVRVVDAHPERAGGDQHPGEDAHGSGGQPGDRLVTGVAGSRHQGDDARDGQRPDDGCRTPEDLSSGAVQAFLLAHPEVQTTPKTMLLRLPERWMS